jgi:hypothetical protein
MSVHNRPTKAQALAGVLALIAGTQKHDPNGSFTIGNATFTAASLLQLLQGLADTMTRRDEAKTAAADALTELRDVAARVKPLMAGYRAILLATYAGASQTLADYGLAPPKARTPLTVEQKAAAKAKREATRKARGTKGPKARLAIKGTTAAPEANPPAPPSSP